MIKDCPFCNGVNCIVTPVPEKYLGARREDDPTIFQVICCTSEKSEGCGASSGWYKSRDEAIEKWNARAPVKIDWEPLVNESNDALDQTPEAMFMEIAGKLQDNWWKTEEGGQPLAPAKAFAVLLWDERDDGREYNTRSFTAGMCTSEVIALLEVEKHQFLRELLEDGDE